jgi:hypothetical protein
MSHNLINSNCAVRVGQTNYHACSVLDVEGEVSYIMDHTTGKREHVASCSVLVISALPPYSTLIGAEESIELDLSDLFEPTVSGKRKVAA